MFGNALPAESFTKHHGALWLRPHLHRRGCQAESPVFSLLRGGAGGSKSAARSMSRVERREGLASREFGLAVPPPDFDRESRHRVEPRRAAPAGRLAEVASAVVVGRCPPGWASRCRVRAAKCRGLRLHLRGVGTRRAAERRARGRIRGKRLDCCLTSTVRVLDGGVSSAEPSAVPVSFVSSGVLARCNTEGTCGAPGLRDDSSCGELASRTAALLQGSGFGMLGPVLGERWACNL